MGATIAVQRHNALGRSAPARRIISRRAREITGPVLLASEEGAPRCVARAAVVDGATAIGASRRKLGLHQCVATRHTIQLHGRQGRDAAVEGRCLLVFKFAGCVLAHFDDGHAMRRDFLVGFANRAWVRGGAAGVQELVGQGLVVDHQQTSVIAVYITGSAACVQSKVFHAVMVVARAVVIVGVGTVVLESGCAGGQRITQCINRRGGIACCDHDCIQFGFGNGLKTQRCFVGRSLCDGCRCRVAVAAAGAQGQGAQYCGTGCAQAGLENTATAQARVNDVIERRVTAGVVVFAVLAVEGQSLSACPCVHRENLSLKCTIAPQG